MMYVPEAAASYGPKWAMVLNEPVSKHGSEVADRLVMTSAEQCSDLDQETARRRPWQSEERSGSADRWYWSRMQLASILARRRFTLRYHTSSKPTYRYQCGQLRLSVCRNRSNRVNFPPAVAWLVILDIGACDFDVCSLGQCRKLLREALARRNRIWLSWCTVAHRLYDQRIVL